MKTFLPVAMAAMMLAACSTPFPVSPDSASTATTKPAKLQASAHWLMIAKDVADQIKLGTDKVGAPVYVTPPPHGSKFAHVFYEQVVTSLVDQGVTVRRVHDMTTQVVDIDAQLVRFSGEPSKRFLGIGTTSTVPTYQVVVTTSLTKNAQYLTRRTDTYDVSDDDVALYNNASDFNFKVVGGQ